VSFDNAFIGYNNYFTASASSLTASGVDTGFSINSLKNWQAFDYVQFASGTNYAQIDCGSAVNIDYVAICAHELFTKNCTAITIKGSSRPDIHNKHDIGDAHTRCSRNTASL
jgi:hypothetical protein